MWYCLLTLLCLPYVLTENLDLPEGSACTWEGVNGKCVSIYRCFGAVLDKQDKKHPPICSYEDTTPIICCTDCELVNDTRLMLVNRNLGILEKTGTSKAKDKCLDYIHTLNYPCKENQKTIVSKKLNEEKHCYERNSVTEYYTFVILGGRAAKRGEFPHMICHEHAQNVHYIGSTWNQFERDGRYNCHALLGYGDNADSADWFCGGSVISERFVLTAGHCISSPSLGEVKYVAVGLLKRSDPSELWQLLNVKRIIPHPEYKPPSKYHDIALLETETDFKFTNVFPACLHVDDRLDEIAQATGWGALGHKKGLSDTLQAVLITKYSESECEERYPKHRHLKQGINHSTQICYGDRGDDPKDTCPGDSGGPLQSLEHQHCVYTILGITSYGRQCGYAQSTGVYTQVKHYVPWIEEIVWP